jgi:hypothetical protein
MQDDRYLHRKASLNETPISTGRLSAWLGRSRKIGLILALANLPASLRANPFSSIVVYGDSLSDNGNIYNASGNTYPASPPYYNGRLSNGPVTVEQMAATWGVPLYGFAYGGATTGIGNASDGGTTTSLGSLGLPGMQRELAGTQGSLGSLVDFNTSLFVVWGGPNDFLSAFEQNTLSQQTVDKAVSDPAVVRRAYGADVLSGCLTVGAQHGPFASVGKRDYASVMAAPPRRWRKAGFSSD